MWPGVSVLDYNISKVVMTCLVQGSTVIRRTEAKVAYPVCVVMCEAVPVDILRLCTALSVPAISQLYHKCHHKAPYK